MSSFLLSTLKVLLRKEFAMSLMLQVRKGNNTWNLIKGKCVTVLRPWNAAEEKRSRKILGIYRLFHCILLPYNLVRVINRCKFSCLFWLPKGQGNSEEPKIRKLFRLFLLLVSLVPFHLYLKTYITYLYIGATSVFLSVIEEWLLDYFS